MEIPSYKNKTFIVESNMAIVRLDNLTPSKYKDGDIIPDGKNIGDVKTIPKRTEIVISNTKVGSDRIVYVFAEPADPNPEIPSGWTLAENLEGSFLNEIIGFSPSSWDAQPQGDNYTVTDANALIRTGPPNFTSTGAKIAQGSYLIVTMRRDKFAKVSEAVINNGEVTAGNEIGWTAGSNLTDGCSQVFFSDEWKDDKGANACWRGGKFIGAKVLVNIVGVGSEVEQITLDTLAPYLKLKDEAAKKNLVLAIESAFRTYAKQAYLYELYLNHNGNLAAAPGSSNHQHGQAFDLNTRWFDRPLYLWLRKNGQKLGFIRTVKCEHWHWEYRPDEAKSLEQQELFGNGNVRKENPAKCKK